MPIKACLACIAAGLALALAVRASELLLLLLNWGK
jgi:hypothetical protein